jgi:hypothetical protein
MHGNIFGAFVDTDRFIPKQDGVGNLPLRGCSWQRREREASFTNYEHNSETYTDYAINRQHQVTNGNTT